MIKRGNQNKKGQVTLFIIIAIVIVAIAALVIVLWPRISGLFMTKQSAQQLLATQGSQIQKAVTECIAPVATDIFYTMGWQAGYYTTELYAVDFGGPKYVVLYKDDNKVRVNKLPSLELMKSEFTRALEAEGNARIDSCLNNFASFKRVVDIETGERKINATITEDSIFINVDWPIKLSKTTAQGTVEQTINQKQVEVLIPLGRVWTFANDIVNYEAKQDNFEDMEDSYNWKYPERREHLLLYTARAPTYKQVIYMITTEPYREGEMEYNFYFAVDRS
ncbi:MAG: hypothetical protein ACPLXC_00620 [Candidatus Pacearchaeota archaeon]